MTAILDHIGLNVSDLELSLNFYCTHFGFSERKRFKASDSQDGLLGLNGVNAQIPFLENDGISLELKEYSSPPNTNVNPSSSIHDVGLAHLCFQIETIDDWYSTLSGDIEFISSPLPVASGAKIANLRDPDGNIIVLVERP